MLRSVVRAVGIWSDSTWLYCCNSLQSKLRCSLSATMPSISVCAMSSMPCLVTAFLVAVGVLRLIRKSLITRKMFRRVIYVDMYYYGRFKFVKLRDWETISYKRGIEEIYDRPQIAGSTRRLPLCKVRHQTLGV